MSKTYRRDSKNKAWRNAKGNFKPKSFRPRLEREVVEVPKTNFPRSADDPLLDWMLITS